MKDMNPLMKLCLGLGLVGIIVVVVQAQMAESTNAHWTALAKARAAGFTVEALENARAEVEDTDVEPWCSFYLAMELYSEGEDLDRARQVAEASIEKYRDHATTPMMAELLDALKSYSDS